MLNAQWLETFTSLCDTGGFSRAADRLQMTQPGVSQHLRKLEQQVGKALISRSGKSFTLTSAGEALYQLGLARRREEEALRSAIGHDDPGAGPASVGCSGSFATLLYPDLVCLMSDHPRLQVHLEAAPQRTILTGIAEGVFDLGLLDHRPDRPRVSAERISFEELCLVLPGNAPAAVPRFEDLEARGFIAHPDGYAYADALLSLNYPREFRGSGRLAIRGFSNQIGQIPAPVAAGVGYTILPRSGIRAFSQREKLRVQPLEYPVRRELWLAWREGRELPARLVRIAGIIRTLAAGLDNA